MRSRRASALALVGTVVLVPACGREPAGPARRDTSSTPAAAVSRTAPGGPEVVRLQTGTQATLGDLRIGAGNFQIGDYVDGEGRRRSGPTMGLWLYVRDDPAQDGHLRVGRGSRFARGGLTVEILEVRADTVHLRARPR